MRTQRASSTRKHRLACLRELVASYHRRLNGDYDTVYEHFAATYLPEDEKTATSPIPRFAVITRDETYSMIELRGTQAAALQNLNRRLGNDTLGTSGDIVDLDAMAAGDEFSARVPVRTVVLSEEAYELVARMFDESAVQDPLMTWVLMATAPAWDEVSTLFTPNDEQFENPDEP